MDAYICVAETFCFSPETITALFVFFFLKVYLFWLCCCEPAFSSGNEWGYSLLRCWASRYRDPSYFSAQTLERWLSSCAARAQPLRACGVPQSGKGAPAPALAGGLPATRPPRTAARCSLPVRRRQRWKPAVQFSRSRSLPLRDPRNPSTPGLPVRHQLPQFTQTHVHRVGDAIQPCHPLPSPSPPALNLSQHEGLFQ